MPTLTARIGREQHADDNDRVGLKEQDSPKKE